LEDVGRGLSADSAARWLCAGQRREHEQPGRRQLQLVGSRGRGRGRDAAAPAADVTAAAAAALRTRLPAGQEELPRPGPDPRVGRAARGAGISRSACLLFQSRKLLSHIKRKIPSRPSG